MSPLSEAFVQDCAARMCRSRHVHGAVIAIAGPDPAPARVAAGGNLRPESLFFAASTTKLLVTIAVMRLIEAGRIALDDPIVRHLPDDVPAGLHVMDGVDRTGEITIRHLISSQSGLPDYFSLKGKDGRTEMARLLAGEDSAWPLERTLAAIRGIRPRFAPGTPRKVQYSDTNYQLLGRMLERLSGQDLPGLFASEIFAPLGLGHSYIYTDPADDRPAPIHAGPRVVHLPHYMASITAEGGLVTTATDLLAMGRAFFAGRFFDIDAFLRQQDWRMLFLPGQFWFGMGLEKLWTPWFWSPLHPVRDIMGFWGQTGAFVFHHPDSGLTFAGTVNQANGWGHASALRAMLRAIRAARC
ncbi:MAG: beta-lactamase family protein [Rhodobacteraceae bacterium]|nr:beta-lactamase family protein [Paracoccaceae bacterium]